MYIQGFSPTRFKTQLRVVTPAGYPLKKVVSIDTFTAFFLGSTVP